MRVRKSPIVALAVLAVTWTPRLHAEQHPSPTPPPTSQRPTHYVAAYGVPLAPPVYLVNFLLLYFSKPDLAAFLPAYRAQLPQDLYQCLLDGRENGCPYDFAAPLLAEQAADSGGSGNKIASWPPESCQTDPQWQHLAPPPYRLPDQINQPLGGAETARIARALGFDQAMVLTERQYECMITPNGGENDAARAIIDACFPALTNSNGNASPALSSYGLNLDEQGVVRSLCAPGAPCLEGNKLFFGPLEKIASECRFEEKLARLLAKTQIRTFAVDGGKCQNTWASACIAEDECPGNGSQSSNNCAPSLADPEP
jgi:hypothetical protein